MSTIMVLTIIFVLSLIASFVLFKFFKSTAIIKKRTYQAGGAAAGFIIIYSVLWTSYFYIERNEYRKIINDYRQLHEKFEEKSIRGKIIPPKKNTLVVLAVTEKTPDKKGEFQLRAPCIDLARGEYRIFVIDGDTYFPWDIYTEADMTGIEIPLETE